MHDSQFHKSLENRIYKSKDRGDASHRIAAETNGVYAIYR